MGTETLFNINETTGAYTIERPVSASEILHQAEIILGERFKPGTQINNPADVEKLLISKLAHFENEVFGALFLKNDHSIICFEKLFFGTINGASVYPREVVKRALQLNAAAVIFAHNHPSGVAEPSRADREITEKLKGALDLVDIKTLDHIVVAGLNTVSMSRRGLI